MSGDINWGDMPEELALQLYDLQQRTFTRRDPFQALNQMRLFQEWLEENIEPCKAEPYHAKDAPSGRCSELPVPGSDFCPLHMPRGDMGEDG